MTAVNGLRYREMISYFLWYEINDMDVRDMSFQQDDATCHITNEIMQLFKTKCNGRVISRPGEIN